MTGKIGKPHEPAEQGVFDHIEDDHFQAERERRESARNERFIALLDEHLVNEVQTSDDIRALFASIFYAFDLPSWVMMGNAIMGMNDAQSWRKEAQKGSTLETIAKMMGFEVETVDDDEDEPAAEGTETEADV